MLEAILNYLRGADGMSSVELAHEFLKFKNPDPTLAHRAISGILGKDRRCFFGEEGLWHASPIPANEPDSLELRSAPWRAVHVLTGNQENRRNVFHVSMWSVLPAAKETGNQWLQSPDLLTQDERSALVSNLDSPYENKRRDVYKGIAQQCQDEIPVFLSGRQYGALRQSAAAHDISLTEDFFLISHLFSAAGLPMSKPVTLAGCYRAIFQRDPICVSARSHGEVLAQCVGELIERAINNGIATMADLEEALCAAAASFDFSHKGFSYNDLFNLPPKPGVYAFTTKTGAFLYIGKASNLRRRVMGYFRQTDESPEKLNRLRNEAHFLTTHICGSELESLIYEYRLIRKHSPVLNLKTEINERKGNFKPIHDCVILLPHTDKSKGMSFWFRQNQKILLKPFDADFKQSDLFCADLERFFFSNKLPAQSTDFPEQEITVRWIKSHAQDLVMIPVNRVNNAAEMYAAIRGYWDEVKKT
jgi:hypothetical protein